MDPTNLRQAREATCLHRIRPAELVPIRVPFESGGRLPVDPRPGPVELSLEVTDTNGEPAPWLDDQWWTGLIQRWADDPVVVRILPTPGALLHPVIQSQVGMLRRVVPGWRVLVHAYVDDVFSEEDVSTVAAAAFDEVRFIDQRRPGRSEPERTTPFWPIDELFGRIRIAQSRMYRVTPVLVRLPAKESQVFRTSRDDSPMTRSLVRQRVPGVSSE